MCLYNEGGILQQERLAKLAALAWRVPRPDHWGCFSWRRESPVVECQVVWPGRVTEAGSDLTNVFPFIALLSTTSHSVLPNRQKPPQKTLRWCHSYAKQACFQRMNVYVQCVCEQVCVCVCACVAWVADSITWRTITLACQQPKDLRKISRLNHSAPLLLLFFLLSPTNIQAVVGTMEVFWQNQKCNVSPLLTSLFDQWQVLILATNLSATTKK